jgi:hypothetical protein
MSTAVEAQKDEWIGIRLASKISRVSPYGIQRYGLAGMVRTRFNPPFKITFHRGDVERVAASLAVSSSVPSPIS